MEQPPSSGQDYAMPPSRGPQLWNAFPQEDQYFGMPSLELTKMMECRHGVPQDDVITFETSAMVDLTLCKLLPIIIASQMKLISA